MSQSIGRRLTDLLAAAQLLGTLWLSWWSDERYDLPVGGYVSDHDCDIKLHRLTPFLDRYLRRHRFRSVRVSVFVLHHAHGEGHEGE